VNSHTALQAQIIELQNVLLTTFLYGPTSTHPISHQLANINTASRAAGTSAVDILAAQLQRQQAARPPTPRSSHSPVRRMRSNSTRTTAETKYAPQSLVRYQETSKVRSSSPVNTTVLEWRGRLQPERTDTDTTTMTGLTSHGMNSEAHDLYCSYAIDLQQHRTQELSETITSDPNPYCPHCKGSLHLSPGKAWELLMDGDGYERCFKVSNRFVVKCHRDGADGQYTCVLCTRHASCHTICGDVKALIKHIWAEHSIAELKNEEDITEVVELNCDRRRDSGLTHSVSNSSRRSASVGPHRYRSKHAFEREAEPHEFRSSRRGA
jgi:coenzyme F420-reducing hydrogenase delta subunit